MHVAVEEDYSFHDIAVQSKCVHLTHDTCHIITIMLDNGKCAR